MKLDVAQSERGWEVTYDGIFGHEEDAPFFATEGEARVQCEREAADMLRGMLAALPMLRTWTHFEMTLGKRIAELVSRHGSLRAVARITQIDGGYLSRLASGEKTSPSKTILRKLGLRLKRIEYERQ